MTVDLGGPTSRYYISQRLRLHYVDWGNPDAPPLLLVHGGRDHWFGLKAGSQISKLLVRNQSSTRASQKLGLDLKNLALPNPGTQADDVD